jgi:hypothetical protein
MADDLDAADYEVTLEDGETVNAADFITVGATASGKKVQLEQFEPIDENAEVTADLSDLSPQDTLDVLDSLGQLSRDACERNLARRYEEHVRKEAFDN